MWAGIYPIGGAVKELANIANISTNLLVSSISTVYDFDINAFAENREKKCSISMLEDVSYSQLELYTTNSDMINKLIKSKRNKNPNKVYFTTERNIHLKSHLVELHGIIGGVNKAEIFVNIINPKLIEITTKNCIGFTLSLPCQIDKDEFLVNINGKLFSYKNVRDKQLCFKTRNKIKEIKVVPKINYLKGIGLLSVYLGELRIVMSDHPSENISKCAKTFANPSTNTIFPEILVDYPIYTESNLTDNLLKDNLILINLCRGSQLYKDICNFLTIRCENTGFVHNSEYHEGEYVVMQVIGNPFDDTSSILMVETNNENLLSKNLFTRKLIMPYYVNGRHKFLSNTVLIYMNGEYSTVCEVNNELLKIT